MGSTFSRQQNTENTLVSLREVQYLTPFKFTNPLYLCEYDYDVEACEYTHNLNNFKLD